MDRARFSSADWAHYLEINRIFAERAAAAADDGALVWIHDYNLWMVPAYLRQLLPDLRIGFFHHTSFPPVDVFNVIPWAGQVVGSLARSATFWRRPKHGASASESASAPRGPSSCCLWSGSTT